MTTNQPTAAPVVRSAAAERMRLHRERQRQGLRCLMIELRETEIAVLAARGFLRAEDRNDEAAVKRALYSFLDFALNT